MKLLLIAIVVNTFLICGTNAFPPMRTPDVDVKSEYSEEYREDNPINPAQPNSTLSPVKQPKRKTMGLSHAPRTEFAVDN